MSQDDNQKNQWYNTGNQYWQVLRTQFRKLDQHTTEF